MKIIIHFLPINLKYELFDFYLVIKNDLYISLTKYNNVDTFLWKWIGLVIIRFHIASISLTWSPLLEKSWFLELILFLLSFIPPSSLGLISSPHGDKNPTTIKCLPFSQSKKFQSSSFFPFSILNNKFGFFFFFLSLSSHTLHQTPQYFAIPKHGNPTVQFATRF